MTPANRHQPWIPPPPWRLERRARRRLRESLGRRSGLSIGTILAPVAWGRDKGDTETSNSCYSGVKIGFSPQLCKRPTAFNEISRPE